MEATETKKQAQERVSAKAATLPRTIERKKVAGAGGRVRTVSICEAGCWHGSTAQARKCKNAHWVVVRAAS